ASSAAGLPTSRNGASRESDGCSIRTNIRATFLLNSLSVGLGHRSSAAVRVEHVLAEPLAEEYLRFTGVERMRDKPDHGVLELRDEIGELRIPLLRPQLVRHLEGDRHDRARVVRQRRLRHQDLMIPIGKALHHFRSGLLAREVEEELLDVLNLERALLKSVL